MDGDHEAEILQFQEICGMEDADLARQTLEQFSWNLELAIQEYLNAADGNPNPSLAETEEEEEQDHDQAGTSNELRRRTVQGTNDNTQSGSNREEMDYSMPHTNRHLVQNQTWSAWAYDLVRLPFRFFYSTFYDLLSFIYRLIFSPLRPAVTDAVGDVSRFIESYELKFGTDHPIFFPGSYSQALTEAKKGLKFLLVYLHSDQHQNTDQFCRGTLSNPDLRRFINTNAIFWACSVQLPEGYRVSMAMRETTYPFLALICLRENRMMVVLRKEGMCTPEEIIAFLSIAIQDNETSLNLARQERQQHEFNQILRQQQEEAFQQSLDADREREQQKNEQERQQRQIIEDERRKFEETEREMKDLVSKRDALRANFPPEPSAIESAQELVRVSLKFPNGARLERKFLPTDSLELLYNFAFIQSDCPKEFTIATGFPPRRNISCTPNETLESAGLLKSILLLVIDNNA